MLISSCRHISVRHEWTNPFQRFLVRRQAFRHLICFLTSWCRFSFNHLILVRWQFKQIPHSFMDDCTLWLSGGALGRLGRMVIFRPIKSGVQVCGIIHHPKGLATFSAITACFQTLKIAGRWTSHYNHPSLQWKMSDRRRESKVCL